MRAHKTNWIFYECVYFSCCAFLPNFGVACKRINRKITMPDWICSMLKILSIIEIVLCAISHSLLLFLCVYIYLHLCIISIALTLASERAIELMPSMAQSTTICSLSTWNTSSSWWWWWCCRCCFATVSKCGSLRICTYSIIHFRFNQCKHT